MTSRLHPEHERVNGHVFKPVGDRLEECSRCGHSDMGHAINEAIAEGTLPPCPAAAVQHFRDKFRLACRLTAEMARPEILQAVFQQALALSLEMDRACRFPAWTTWTQCHQQTRGV